MRCILYFETLKEYIKNGCPHQDIKEGDLVTFPMYPNTPFIAKEQAGDYNGLFIYGIAINSVEYFGEDGRSDPHNEFPLFLKIETPI